MKHGEKKRKRERKKEISLGCFHQRKHRNISKIRKRKEAAVFLVSTTQKSDRHHSVQTFRPECLNAYHATQKRSCACVSVCPCAHITFTKECAHVPPDFPTFQLSTLVLSHEKRPDKIPSSKLMVTGHRPSGGKATFFLLPFSFAFPPPCTTTYGTMSPECRLLHPCSFSFLGFFSCRATCLGLST
uniref:Uncharacterized protein n=1 Tax=Palpitomonas bilix TaxID=652834 RepID=A0A7S3G679_9EUKA